MTGEAFGVTPDGDEVRRYRISGGGLAASVLDWGAVLQDLRLDGHDAPLVLGFDAFEAYQLHSPYFGAIVGRFANRIAGGRFTIDGERFQADRNEGGRHTLHGGHAAMSSRVWTVTDAGDAHLTLALRDPHGWMGFPGNLEITCTYRIELPATLSLLIEARSDRSTLCSIAHHPYFNLDDGGAGSALDHRLLIPAKAYLPVDDEQIPTGRVEPVKGTAFDFTIAKPLRQDWNGSQLAYDHNFCLASFSGKQKLAAWLQGSTSGIEMELWTSEPGLQLYAGHKIDCRAPGLGGRTYGAYSGIALEAQNWPDAPNRPYFPPAVLSQGDVYRHQTRYIFRQPAAL